MRNIQLGMKLIVKPERCDAYGMSHGAIVEVARLRFPRGYKTPWVYDHNGYAYKPSDFAHEVA